MNNQVIPAEAVEAAAKVLYLEDHLWDEPWETASDAEKYRTNARLTLEAAAPHMGEMEWAVFRASDGEDGTPVEGFRYPSREAAQKSINSGYTQPQFWEPRGRVVGKWTADAV